MNRYQRTINKAKTYLNKITDPAHGMLHAESVAETADLILQNYPNIDQDLIELCAFWHDVGRVYNLDHEAISAGLLAESLRSEHYKENLCIKAYKAIVYHRWDMQPETLEGEIIRDADKLDFISIPRWQNCLKHHDFSFFYTVIEPNLLSPLRDTLLHLDSSKKLYDERIIPFRQFITRIDDANFIEIKQKVLQLLP